jgi:hypothetical protein
MSGQVNDNLSKADREDALRFLGWLEQEEYANVKFANWLMQADGAWIWAGVRKEGFMWGVTAGRMGDRTAFLDRWLYSTCEAAIEAIEAWTDGAEPPGWRLHPATGERRPGGGAS